MTTLSRSTIVLMLIALFYGCKSDGTADNAHAPEAGNVEKKASQDTSYIQGDTEIIEIEFDTSEPLERTEMTADTAASQEDAPQEINPEAAPEKAPKPKPKKRPKIAFEKTTYNYGIIMQGDTVKHRFKFKNTGNAALSITHADASCGCTQPGYPFNDIAPGEEGHIEAVFNSKGKLGKQRPVITIYTNARPRTYKLYLDGFVDAQRQQPQNTRPDSL